jgi:hypothetical protein
MGKSRYDNNNKNNFLQENFPNSAFDDAAGELQLKKCSKTYDSRLVYLFQRLCSLYSTSIKKKEEMKLSKMCCSIARLLFSAAALPSDVIMLCNSVCEVARKNLNCIAFLLILFRG